MKILLSIFLATLLVSAAVQAGESAVPKDYPLKNCVISGEPLGSGGMLPFKMTHEGTDVWLCCKHCDKKFLKEPARYVQQVKDAAAKK